MWLLSENGSILYEPPHSPLQGRKDFHSPRFCAHLSQIHSDFSHLSKRETISTDHTEKNSVGKKTPANTAMINPEKKGMHKRMGCKADAADKYRSNHQGASASCEE